MPNERRYQGCFCQKYVDAISKTARLEEDVARLKRENAELRKQLGKVRRTALEKPFGESTPSACRLVKPSTPEPVDEAERMRRIGGVMDGCRYVNSVIARAATDFYLNGIPSGVVSRGLGVNKGTLHGDVTCRQPAKPSASAGASPAH
jgi:hypothetical protein